MLRDQLGDAALVVAHPDDEILWFSSLADRVKLLVICFLDVPGQPVWSAGRRAVAEQFPLDNARFLGVTESVTFQGADWSAPRESVYGLEVRPGARTLPGFSAERYRDNFHHLVQSLGAALEGCGTVFTHNPWGEYGHEEHVQVYRAVAEVRKRLGFDLWYSNYCSDRSYPLMLRHTEGIRAEYQELSTNPSLAGCLEQIYRRNDCWTWPYDDYAHFQRECFIPDVATRAHSAAGSTVPLNFVRLERATRSPPSLRRTLMRLRRKLRTTSLREERR